MVKGILWTVVVLLIPAAICSAQSVYYFPQVADGIAGQGGWITGVGVTNPATSGTATGTIAFTKDDGTPWNVSFQDPDSNPVGGGNIISFTIPAGQSRYYISQAAEVLSVG